MKIRVLMVLVAMFFIAPLAAHGQVFGNLHRVVFPQIAFGGNGAWVTTIVATNVSDAPAQVTFGFTAQDGSNLYVPIVERWTGQVISTPSYNPNDIAPKSTYVLNLRSQGPITVGSMVAIVHMVNGKDTIRVQVTYSLLASDGIVLGQAAVFSATPSKATGLQSVRNVNSSTGVAIANINDVATGVRLEARNMAGQVVGSANFTIPAYGQTAKFLVEMMPELSDWSGGLVTITSDQDISVMNLVITGEVFSAGTTF